MARYRKCLFVTGLAGLLLAVTACANAAPPAAAPVPGPAKPPPGHTVASGTFATDSFAYNYDKRLVPDGAKMLVAENVFDGATTVTLAVRGLMPGHAYGAHAHSMPCGAVGDDAGPHFQHMADPVKPSVDPAFANATNEVWLDFATDANGDATVARTVPWVVPNTHGPASVVIHAQPTQTAPGKAGARAACMSVSF